MPKNGEMRTTNFTIDRELWRKFRELCIRLGVTVKYRLAMLIRQDVDKYY